MGKTIPSGGGMKNRTHKNNVQAIGTNLGKICRIIGFFFILGANFWKIGHSGTQLCRWEFCFLNKCDGPKV